MRVGQVSNQVHPLAHERHQQVSHRQIHEVLVGGAPHVPVVPHHQDHQNVAHDGDQEGYDVGDNL